MSNAMNKKRPGRPRKTPAKHPDNLNGIVNQPSKKKRCVEMVYQNPENFKKIFSMIHSINKRTVSFCFKKKRVIILCQDHLKKLNVNVSIMGSNTISYYCQQELQITMENESFNQLCNIIKKNFGQITIYINENDNSSLKVSLNETLHESDDKKTIPISLTSVDQSILGLVNQSYDISFKLDCNHYKKRLTTYNKDYKFCRLVYNGHIEFIYSDVNSIRGTETKYRNNKILMLKNYSASKDIECNFKLENIINIFKTIVSPDCYILMSNDNGICINFYVDPIALSRINVDDYAYEDNVFPNVEKNTFVIRIFVNKNM